MVDNVDIAEAEHEGIVLKPICDELYLVVVEHKYHGTRYIVIDAVLKPEA